MTLTVLTYQKLILMWLYKSRINLYIISKVSKIAEVAKQQSNP